MSCYLGSRTWVGFYMYIILVESIWEGSSFIKMMPG
jgi:hypothetical protein